ncbi:hypothetical protein MHPYR_340029 [uncultured Mycobacterium sp.]|uniref:Uncharacterized protein n=1 Tax=uncultured Mycobacterium sp. TaxID=171292 RepID=A0A1Y5PGP0_9MYCO|nr:hypothetical protein MHPYR_340029 [uncultured Mycobacterium sp.]
MTTTPGLTGLAVAHLPRIRGGDLTRLSWRGWHVDLDQHRVTVPVQPIAGKNIDDLDLLLGAGYRMLDIATAARLSPLPQLRVRLPESMITQIVAVLQSAQRIADIDSHRGVFDVYECTSRAWRDSGMSIPYAVLLRSLRAVLPPGVGNLAGYDRCARPTDVHDLYTAAIHRWRGQDASTRGVSTQIA